MDLNPSLLRKIFCICEIPPVHGPPFQEWNVWQDCISASPTFLDVAILFFVVKELAIHLVFRFFQRDRSFYM